jgi:hypothetical protein
MKQAWQAKLNTPADDCVASSMCCRVKNKEL